MAGRVCLGPIGGHLCPIVERNAMVERDTRNRARNSAANRHMTNRTWDRITVGGFGRILIALAVLSIVSLHAYSQTKLKACRYDPAVKDYANCDFNRTDLRGVDLAGANLKGANLHLASLDGSNLEGADFEGINPCDPMAEEKRIINRMANFSGAALTNANFKWAHFPWAYFYISDLSGANMEGANLKGARFEVAYMAGVNLRGANLQFARLTEADLTGADLTGADLRKANFEYAILDDAKLDGANFTGAFNTEGYRCLGTEASLHDCAIEVPRHKTVPDKPDGARQY